MANSNDSKTIAARAALPYVKEGMLVGLGSGSTASEFVRLLGTEKKLRESITAVCTSSETQTLAQLLGIKLVAVDAVTRVDLTVDGADEITPQLQMIKGGGGALFRERIVARLSADHITIVHQAKLVEKLGGFPLPVEIVPFSHGTTTRWILDALKDGGIAVEHHTLRAAKDGGGRFVTDNGNVIVDMKLAPIADPARAAALLDGIDGVVTHGLFLGLTKRVLVAQDDGSVREIG
ncbi:MAG TPA: ribose-5-phosphate isomerase RpiA [Magnetospirillaceae bacterium]|jgi:ribose 5-phosphate isomerase A